MTDYVPDNYKEPDSDCKYNFLFDTTVFNRLAEHSDWLSIIEQSLNLGFHYYKTANQDDELSGRGAKTYDINCISHVKISDSFRAKMLIFDEIKKCLEIKRLSSIANLMSNHWLGDGTYRILDDTSKVGIMTKEIFLFNEELRKQKPFAQHYDAMSAEAAMYHNCFLVSDDGDLRDIVNKYFPQRAMSTQELVELVQSLLD